ncbi:hypothetical protein [Gordonia sp. FQ]|uniref:hypothetical protein n=1 Tax=Gordonia sp. FQ TaxID=3446634 RepID=UPI003F875FA3
MPETSGGLRAFIDIRAEAAAVFGVLTVAANWPLLLPEGMVADRPVNDVTAGAEFPLRLAWPFTEAAERSTTARFGVVDETAGRLSLELRDPRRPLTLVWSVEPVPGGSATRAGVTVDDPPPDLSEFSFQQAATRALYGLAALGEGPELWASTPRGFEPRPRQGTWGGGMPPARRVIRLFPDWGRDYPLWENSAGAWDVGYTTGPDTYFLSPELAGRLAAWQRDWEGIFDEDREPDPRASARWRTEGDELALLLADEVAEYADVEYRP